MTQEEIKQLGFDHYIIPMHDTGYGEYNAVEIDNLVAYTAAVEAPLQARIAQLEEALNDIASGEIGINLCVKYAIKVLAESPSTWLSDHDKEVRKDQIKIDAGICEIQDGIHDALYAEAIIYQHK